MVRGVDACHLVHSPRPARELLGPGMDAWTAIRGRPPRSGRRLRKGGRRRGSPLYVRHPRAKHDLIGSAME